jgi:hypothetical protein
LNPILQRARAPGRDQNHQIKAMKPIPIAIKRLTAFVLVVLAAGCAGNLLDKENVAVGAGFKVITPTKPDQQALLRKLPADKLTRITYDGKIYYVLPDLANNQAYVGGPKQYQTYVQMRRTQEKNSDTFLVAPDPNQPDSMIARNPTNWGEWGGWGGWFEGGPGGWY